MTGTDLQLAGGDPGRVVPVYACLPPAPRHAIVILHEILGPQPEIRRVVERFAAAGYAAVAPDLFANGARAACIRDLIWATATGAGPVACDVLAVRAWLSAEVGIAPDRIALLGLCLTGGFALAIARGWGAVSANYGSLPPREHLRGIAPVIACYGGRDRVFGRFAARLEADLAAVGTPGEVHVFPTVGHSFLTDGAHPVLEPLLRPAMGLGYEAEVAEEAWGRIFGFFEERL